MAEQQRGTAASVKELEREVRALRSQMQRLELSLADGIVTQELIVGGPDGRPRIVMTATENRGSIEIVTRSPDGSAGTSVELFATDPEAGSGHHVGLVLTRGGDVVAGFETSDTNPPEVWMED